MNNLNYNYNKIYLEKTNIYSGLYLNKNIVDGRPMAINKKYLAVSSINDGEISIFDSSEPYKIENIQSYIKINDNKTKIQDLEFSPFNENILPLAYENKSIVLWKIPEGNMNKNKTKVFQIYKNHNNKVNYVAFNPIVDNTLCSDSSDNEIHIWNIEKMDDYIKFNIDENPSMISWNPNGDLIGVSSKKNINIFDPRNENFVIKQNINERYHPPKLAWIDNNLFVSTVRDKNMKLLKLWDIRKYKDFSLNESEISSIEINQLKPGIFTPFINKELKIIYIIGKDKKNINLLN
jgi:WD40 repeat protein